MGLCLGGGRTHRCGIGSAVRPASTAEFILSPACPVPDCLGRVHPVSALRYWKVALGLVLVFAAGAISGAVGTRHLLARNFNQALNFDRWKAGTMQVLQT